MRRLPLLAALALSGVLSMSAQPSVAADEDFGREIVSLGHDALLPASESAEEVVAVFGDASTAGPVSGDVVSVFGDTHTTAPVGDSAVAVLGNVSVDSKVQGTVVAVLGNVTLGPQAEVGDGVVVVFGHLESSPGAVVHGGIQRIFPLPRIEGLQAWLRHCLLYGRLLSLDPGVRWAWELALGVLVLYALLALLFPQALSRCVQTLERYPGRALLTAILALLVSPLLFVVLAITVIGIALVPLTWLAVSLFGKAVAVGWIGRRCLSTARGAADTAHPLAPVLEVLLGGVVVLGLYLVPVIGMLTYLLLGALGFGAVIYTVLEHARTTRAQSGTAGEAGTARASVAGGASSASYGAASSGAHGAGVSMPPPADAGATPAANASAPPPADRAGPSAALDLTLQPRAGFWIRMGALFIDLLLVAVVLSLFERHSHGNELLALALYGAIMWKLKGTTVGGAICHLKVVRLDGRPLDWGSALLRALGCFLSLVVAGLGFIWIAIDPQRQAWHDKIAGTVVVSVPSGVPLL